MINKGLTALLGLLLFCGPALAGEYRYLEPSEMRQWLERGKEMVIVDIQQPQGFARHHFQGAIETNAFPTETDEERHRLDQAREAYQRQPADVVVVCPRGGGGAKRTYDYLKSKGVPEGNLYILTGGMDRWPYPEFVRTR